MPAPWTNHCSQAVPLPRAHVDTDQIAPKQFLKATGRSGYAQALFHDWRFDEHGQPRSEFVLNRPQYTGAAILLAGENFGCGSSREHAAWALIDYGFKAVVAPSFADIFAANAARNRLLAAAVPAAAVAGWLDRAAREPLTLRLDLETQTATAAGEAPVAFTIPAFHRRCLLEGLDEIGLALAHASAIAAYESRAV